MDYKAAVAQGRTLLARSDQDQWELAELTYQVLVVEKKATLTQWAKDLGVSIGHASTLRNVWVKYGHLYRGKGRSTQTFSHYYTLARSSPERAARVDREAKARGRSVTTVDRGLRPADRVKHARELIRDRDVMRDLLGDPATRATLRRIFEREFARKPPKPGESRPKVSARNVPQQLFQELTDFRDRLNQLLGRVIHVKVDGAVHASLVKAAEDVSNSLEWLETYLESGDTSFEETLERILVEGSPAPAAPPRGRPAATRKAPPPQRTEPVGEPAAVEEPAAAPPDKPARRERVPRKTKSTEPARGRRGRDRVPEPAGDQGFSNTA